MFNPSWKSWHRISKTIKRRESRDGNSVELKCTHCNTWQIFLRKTGGNKAAFEKSVEGYSTFVNWHRHGST